MILRCRAYSLRASSRARSDTTGLRGLDGSGASPGLAVHVDFENAPWCVSSRPSAWPRWGASSDWTVTATLTCLTCQTSITSVASITSTTSSIISASTLAADTSTFSVPSFVFLVRILVLALVVKPCRSTVCATVTSTSTL